MAVAALSALTFFAVALVVNGQGTVWLDAPVASAVRGWPVPPDVWRAITQAGGLFLVLVGAALVVALAALGRLRMAVVVAIALLGAFFLTDAVKTFVARPRPPDPIAAFSGYSFPSGHTLNATVTYGIAALLLWRSGLSPTARRAAVIALVVLIAAVGLSRIGLGVHYASDVVAGWLAGTTIVAIVALADRADRARIARPGVSRSARRR
jgi:undecaprenyl-diphosphatase